VDGGRRKSGASSELVSSRLLSASPTACFGGRKCNRMECEKEAIGDDQFLYSMDHLK
jgi:hypothetical protein